MWDVWRIAGHRAGCGAARSEERRVGGRGAGGGAAACHGGAPLRDQQLRVPDLLGVTAAHGLQPRHLALQLGQLWEEVALDDGLHRRGWVTAMEGSRVSVHCRRFATTTGLQPFLQQACPRPRQRPPPAWTSSRPHPAPPPCAWVRGEAGAASRTGQPPGSPPEAAPCRRCLRRRRWSQAAPRRALSCRPCRRGPRGAAQRARGCLEAVFSSLRVGVGSRGFGRCCRWQERL